MEDIGHLEVAGSDLWVALDPARDRGVPEVATLVVVVTLVVVAQVIPGNGNCSMKRIVFFLLVFLSVQATAQRAIPELWGHRMHDEAHILSSTTIDELENKLKLHEDSTTNQIAVLIIPSLDGDVLEEYAIRVAHDTWKLGQAGNDNGVLLLIAVDDRKMRIEVGQGLEGVLTDALTSRIIRNEIAPHFREQNYDAGVKAGVDAIIDGIGNEYSVSTEDSDTFEPVDMTWKERLLIGAFIFGILGVFTLIGLLVPGCTGWFMYAFLIPFYAAFPMAVLGVNGGLSLLGLYIIAFPILKIILSKTSWGQRMASKMNSGQGGNKGGWSSGSGWFGSSGGSSSGGGFSGGGGGFSGGGSSGSW